MESRFNINILLCEGEVTSTSNITSIFDKIRIFDNKLSFTVFVLINTINYLSKHFTLLLILIKIGDNDDDKAVSLGRIDYEKADSLKSALGKSRYDGSSQKISNIFFKDAYLPGAGNYELVVYKYEEPVTEEDAGDINNMDDSKLVASYGFIVEE